jgi:hypothetical protein
MIETVCGQSGCLEWRQGGPIGNGHYRNHTGPGANSGQQRRPGRYQANGAQRRGRGKTVQLALLLLLGQIGKQVLHH